MKFEEFNQHMAIINGPEAEKIRQEYIHRFVNTSTDKYAKQINTMRRIDATEIEYYIGFLWDHLISSRLIAETEINHALKGQSQKFYVLWDLHSCYIPPNDKAFVKPLRKYCEYPRGSILRLSGEDILAGQEFLPEDLYIFDIEYQSSYILTHEDTKNMTRYCLEAYPAKA